MLFAFRSVLGGYSLAAAMPSCFKILDQDGTQHNNGVWPTYNHCTN